MRLHTRKVEDLRSQIRGLQRLVERSFSNGQDTFAFDLGHAMVEWREAGRTDAEIVEGVEDMISLRMMAGLPNPVRELTER